MGLNECLAVLRDRVFVIASFVSHKCDRKTARCDMRRLIERKALVSKERRRNNRFSVIVLCAPPKRKVGIEAAPADIAFESTNCYVSDNKLANLAVFDSCELIDKNWPTFACTRSSYWSEIVQQRNIDPISESILIEGKSEIVDIIEMLIEAFVGAWPEFPWSTRRRLTNLDICAPSIESSANDVFEKSPRCQLSISISVYIRNEMPPTRKTKQKFPLFNFHL